MPIVRSPLPYGVVVPTASTPAKVEVAVVEVATKYGAEIDVPAEIMLGVIVPETVRSPVTVVVARAVAPDEKDPAPRFVKLPPIAETLIPLSNMPPRKSPLRTMRLERSSILFTI